ncbi:MAG: tetratricopeptide repeat protein [Bacteroidota bacterium]
MNLGCGNRRRDGFVNVDAQAGCHPDLVLDLEQTPWPWPDDSVDEVDLVHVLEHLGQVPAVYLGIMKELWRVCCDGARVRIVVPHPRSDEFLNDPTHVRPITVAGLEMFSQRSNALWQAGGASNTPLGYYLGIDFETESLALDPKQPWLDRLQRGEISEAEIHDAGNAQFNVFSQLTVVLRAVKPAGRLIADPEPEAMVQPSNGSAAPAFAAWVKDKDTALAAGDGAGAQAVLEAVLEQDPDDHEARAHLATVQHALGRREASYDNYRRVAESGVGGFELYNNYGVVALELERADDAVTAFQQALERAPGQRTVQANLAEALGAAGRIKDAIAAYEGLIQDDPRDAATYVGLAKLFISQGWFVDALQALDMAGSFGLDDAEVANQRGIACRELGRYEESLACFEDGLTKAPGDLPLLINLANALARLNRDDDAEEVFRALLAAVGDECPQELGFSFACFLLKRGRTDEGWTYYEARRAASSVFHHPLEAELPQWQGEVPAAGATLLVTAEQGFGDNLQFLRLIPEVASRFERVCVQTRPALSKLLARSLEGICEVVEQVTDDARFDWICPIASLPFALQLSVADWGMAAPYLKVEAMQAALWGFRIPAGRQKKVGLCWNSGKSPRFRHRCDLPWAVVESLLGESAVRWVSLQKGGGEDGRRAMVQAGQLVDLMELVGNFDDTAALISNLDLVITIDTSIAHLAGALGKPVWLLLAFDADWRWLQGRDDSPWYPGMRIFRQTQPGDWAGLGAQVAEQLKTLN